MKNQRKLNYRTILFAVMAAVVFMFATNSVAVAQTTYKVVDKKVRGEI